MMIHMEQSAIIFSLGKTTLKEAVAVALNLYDLTGVKPARIIFNNKKISFNRIKFVRLLRGEITENSLISE